MRKLFIFAVLLLAGCQTTGSSTIGSGPITLSSQIQRYFDQYLADNGMLFTVAVDGRSSIHYFYCPDKICRDKPGVREISIANCEKNSNGVPCKVYAIRKEIVWDFDGAQQESSTGSANGPSDVRVMDISWEGYEDIISTKIDIGSDNPVIALNDSVNCHVALHFKDNDRITGGWTFDCTDGSTASGSFTSFPLGPKRVDTGSGFDSKGNVVGYMILAREDA